MTAPLILGTNSIKDEGYVVDNSLRFNNASNDYLERTPSSTGNKQIWTYSTWIKRCKLGAYQTFLSSQHPSDTSDSDMVRFTNSDTLQFFLNGASSGNIVTNQVFRDTSSWYHIVFAVDTTQSTSSNRVKLYVNGSQVTSFGTETYPSQNYNTYYNTSGQRITILSGAQSSQSGDTDGYLSETVLIDGQQLDATSFGEFDEDTGIWKPIDVSGLTFGTNGFYLDFEDSSALGNDVSGNNNDFTVNNLTSIDQTTDTCTNNFATINPLVRNKSYNDGSLAQGNTYFAPNGRAISCSTFGVTKGKWYAEFKAQDSGALYIGCGQLRGIDALSDGGLSNPIWYDNNPGYAVGYGSGGALEDGTAQTSYGSGYSDNDIVGVALDMDNYEMYISVNGTWQNSGDPTSGASKTGGVTGATSYNPFDDGFPIFFFVSDFSAAGVGECFHNYGNPAFSISSGNSDANGYGNFEYSVPSGYYALNTKNLAEYG